MVYLVVLLKVSTHSRPKAAGTEVCGKLVLIGVSTHSRPKAAGGARGAAATCTVVSTHSRPKAAGTEQGIRQYADDVSTHSRPKAAGFIRDERNPQPQKFQHTAARRRLGRHRRDSARMRDRFNTQPPEGGWNHQPLTLLF